MTNDKMDDDTTPSATEEMLADLGVSGADADELRALLSEVAGLAHEVPEPSDDVRALLGGAIPLRRRRPAVVVAVAASALALGGVSAAAAANQLPDRVQEVVADATGGAIPHPVKPTIPREREVPPPNDDAPGHVMNKPKATKTPEPANTEAPGQIQKLTKPGPTAPGPALPSDPGSHGRAHNPDKTNSSDKPANDADLDDDLDDAGASNGSDRSSDKPAKS